MALIARDFADNMVKTPVIPTMADRVRKGLIFWSWPDLAVFEDQGGFMRYLEKFGMIVFAIILFVSAMATTAEAQRGFHRPIIVRSHMFYAKISGNTIPTAI